MSAVVTVCGSLAYFGRRVPIVSDRQEEGYGHTCTYTLDAGRAYTPQPHACLPVVDIIVVFYHRCALSYAQAFSRSLHAIGRSYSRTGQNYLLLLNMHAGSSSLDTCAVRYFNGSDCATVTEDEAIP